MSRRHLDAYSAYVFKTLPRPFHRTWLDLIEKLLKGELASRKLLIIAPPNHGKSTYLSQIFPCWYTGSHPADNLLFFTSTDTAAAQFNGVVRRTAEDNERHLATFPAETSRPDLARGWSGDGLCLQGLDPANKDPTYRSVGWGASIIGARADGIIIDDPLTQEQAESPIGQEAAKSYYQMTVEPRLQPGGWMLAIMTRWHEADLASYFINSGEWVVVVLPAIAGEGDQRVALWPERFDLAWLDRKRNVLGTAKFACLYLGDPSGLGGVVFRQANWWKDLPSDFTVISPVDGKSRRQRLRTIQYVDLAWSAKTSADYTTVTTAAVDDAGQVYFVDAWRGREEDDETLESGLVATLVNQILLHGPSLVGVEEGAFQVAATRDLVRRVRLRLAGRRSTTIIGVGVDKDKVYRARLHAGRAQAGMVYVDRSAHWWPTWEHEHLGFPNTEHDDLVDGSSGVLAMVATLLGYTPEQNDTYTHTTPESVATLQEDGIDRSWGEAALATDEVKVVRFRPRRRVALADAEGDGDTEGKVGGPLRLGDDDTRFIVPR